MDKKIIELSHMEVIRLISGIFEDDKDQMSARLALCNLVARNSLGLSADDFTDEQLAHLGLRLVRTPT